MSTLHIIHEGLGILNKYNTAKDGAICAEHDELWVSGPSPVDMSLEDVGRLNELGFTWAEDMESWLRFT